MTNPNAWQFYPQTKDSPLDGQPQLPEPRMGFPSVLVAHTLPSICSPPLNTPQMHPAASATSQPLAGG